MEDTPEARHVWNAYKPAYDAQIVWNETHNKASMQNKSRLSAQFHHTLISVIWRLAGLNDYKKIRQAARSFATPNGIQSKISACVYGVMMSAMRPAISFYFYA
jgi:hypothetical protein